MLWLIAAAVFVLDQLTKWIVVGHFFPNESRVFIPHLVYWTFVQNTHGAFGLFGNSPVLLIGMAIVVLGVFWFAFRDAAGGSRAVQLAFGSIAGGAVGNIVDRLHYQYVVDFIDLRWWPVFNVADSCITLGVVGLIITSALRKRQAPGHGVSYDPTVRSGEFTDEYTRRPQEEIALARLRGRSSNITHEFDSEA